MHHRTLFWQSIIASSVHHEAQYRYTSQQRQQRIRFARVSNLRTATTTGLDSGEKNSANFASNKAGESEDAVSKEFCGAKTLWKHLIWARCHSACREHQKPARRLQTGQLTAHRRWERVNSRQTSSDSAKVKTTCEDRRLPLATWLRSANRTASRGTTVNRVYLSPQTVDAAVLQVIIMIIWDCQPKSLSGRARDALPCNVTAAQCMRRRRKRPHPIFCRQSFSFLTIFVWTMDSLGEVDSPAATGISNKSL